jgi:hypothetical protein
MFHPSLLNALVVILLLSRVGSAEVQKFYYLCDVKMSSEAGKPLGKSVLLLEKTHDPDKGRIVERAIEVRPGEAAREFVITMNVTGSTFTATDAKDTIHGTGTLFGPAWQWTYFKATFLSTNGVRIEDENFMTDPSVGCARKKVMSPDGKVLMFMDVTGKAVSQQTFEILADTLLKK